MLDLTDREARIIELPGGLLDECRREARRRGVDPDTLLDQVVRDALTALAAAITPTCPDFDVEGIDLDPPAVGGSP